jgi:hypothetical protein
MSTKPMNLGRRNRWAKAEEKLQARRGELVVLIIVNRGGDDLVPGKHVQCVLHRLVLAEKRGQ